MNNIIITTATVFALAATAATAEDWTNTTFGLEVISDSLDFSIDADDNGLTDLEVGYTALEYSIGENIESNVRIALSTELRSVDTVSLIGQYNISVMTFDNFMVYGTAEVDYTTDTGFNDGIWSFNPSAGVAYAISDRFSAYGEVGYSWDVTNDFHQTGGYVELGVPYAVTETMIITPSISRTFDTGNDVANFRLETTFVF